MNYGIRLVTFDALHTVITPRLPIHVQYSQVFEPYLGLLPPDRIKQSFEVALKTVQQEQPSYGKGARDWWREVIRRTAVNAGANEQSLNSHLNDIVDTLMTRFSSRKGYKAFDDASPTIRCLRERFGVQTAIVSNGDNRIRAVLSDLEFTDYLKPIILSEEEGVEKPSKDIFIRTLNAVNQDLDNTKAHIYPNQCLHIGDSLRCDYHGAKSAGWNALLLRRLEPAGDEEHKELVENVKDVRIIHTLTTVFDWL